MPRDPNLKPTQVTWFLNDVPGAFVTPWTWKQTRGWQPYAVTVVQPDDRFSRLKNPVRLHIDTPGRTLQTVKRTTFERVYIVEQGRTTRGLYTYTLADLRWLLQSAALTASYNVRSWGGKYRAESLDAGAPFTVAGAMRHALKRLADRVTEGIDHKLLLGADEVEIFTNDPRLVATDLPDNLGNSDGGGWVAAKPAEFVPAMLRDAGDLIVTRGGWLRIIDRSARVIGQLEEYVLLDGSIDPKNIAWQIPRKVRVQFEQVYGAPFDIVLGDAQAQAANTTTEPIVNSPGKLTAQNVFPKLDPGAITAVAGAEPETKHEDYVTLDELNAIADIRPFAATEFQLRKRILQPRLINHDPLNANQRAIAEVYEQTLRRHWRRTFRVKNDEIRRRFANVELGKVQPDGTFKAASVVADFVRVFRWQSGVNEPLSRNVSYGVSPFVARWADRESLIFTLDVDNLPPIVQAVHVGALEKDIRFATLRDIVEDNDRATVFESHGEFTSSARIRVYWRGLYVGDTPEKPRTYDLDYDFGSGDAGIVTVRAHGLQAVWSADSPGGPFSLLNLGDLQAHGDSLAQQIMASYVQARAGVLEFGGVEVLATGGVECYGELYEIAVEIGTAAKPYETRTVLDFRPEVRPILPPNTSRSEVPEGVIG